MIQCDDDVRLTDHQFLGFTSAEHGVSVRGNDRAAPARDQLALFPHLFDRPDFAARLPWVADQHLYHLGIRGDNDAIVPAGIRQTLAGAGDGHLLAVDLYQVAGADLDGLGLLGAGHVLDGIAASQQADRHGDPDQGCVTCSH